MNSTSSSAQNVSRSHVTPELSVIAARSSARCTVRPGSATEVGEPAPDAGAACADGGDWSKSNSSVVTPNSDASAYSVLTEGRILPVSIWEIRLGESSSRRASSRRPMPLRSRTARIRVPSSDGASRRLAGTWSSSIASPAACLRLPVRARCTAPHLAVDDRSSDDQEALEDVLPLLIEAEERRRIQDLHAEACPHERSDEGASPAEQARAAEDDGGDRGEGVARALPRVADSELREQDDRAEER